MRLMDYVLQKHAAKKAGLHYDLRIRYPQKKFLASWALTKAMIPEKSGDKVLAVRTSDHSMDWLRFRGTIPPGEGGAGTVEILQSGKLELLAWTPKVISFRIHQGLHLQGKYALILFKKSKFQTSWLLLKGREE